MPNKERRPIVMLANGHSPFDTRIFVKEAQSLTKAGFKVAIIVPYTRNENSEGITVISVPPNRKGFWKLVISPWNIFWKSVAQPSRSIFCIQDSDILGVGILLKLLGRKVVYDAHEDTPLQISYQHWIPNLLKKPYAFFYFCLEKFCGWLFDAIIVAEPVIANYFPKRKTHLVRNFPIFKRFELHPSIPYQNRVKKLIYVGTLSKVRGLFQMLDGAELAQKKATFEFAIGGQFAPNTLKNEVLANYQINFLNWLSFEDLLKFLFESRIGIIIPNPIERYKTNYPVKLFEYMAAGIPVIASKEGEAAKFVKEGECGILVDPMNIEQIEKAITWLFTNPVEAEAMGIRGRMLIEQKYNWEMENEVLLDVYNNI
jgi:glycosyltransferase involved in cell wall biosynthesis